MPTYIPRYQKPASTGQRFAEAFANAGHEAATQIPAFLNQQKEQRLQESQLAGENEAAKRFGIDIAGIRNAKMREKILGEQLESKSKEELLNKKQSFLKDLFGGDAAQGKGKELSGETSQAAGFDPASISDADILRANTVDPNMGRALQAAKDTALRERREDRNLKEKKIETLRTETLPIRKEISDRAEVARRGIENKQKQIELIDTGKIDDPSFAIAMEALPLKLGQRFLSNETVEYKSGLVQGYGELKNIFSGATRVKEVEILENKIADLYLTDEQKKTILKSSLDVLKADIIREEAAAELEGKPLSLLQYRKEVEKIAKPKLDALFNKIIDEQNAIIKDAENAKKMALDDSDPEDAQIIDQILQESGGDWRKAEKLAKERGYKF